MFTAKELEEWEHLNVHNPKRLHDKRFWEKYSTTEPEWLVRHSLVKKHFENGVAHKQMLISSYQHELDMRRDIMASAMAIWQGIVQNPNITAFFIGLFLEGGFIDMMQTIQTIVETQRIEIENTTERLNVVRHRPILLCVPELYASTNTLAILSDGGAATHANASDYVEYTSEKIPFIP